MSDGPEQRQLHLLVPDLPVPDLLVPDDRAASVLVGADGSLPAWTVELGQGETTMMAARRSVGEHLGLGHHPVLEVFFDFGQSHDDRGAGAVPTLVVFEAIAAGWDPPSRWEWRGLPLVDPNLPVALRGRLGEWMAEFGGAAVPPLRPRWSRPGWFARAAAWIDDELAKTGRSRTGPLEQIRFWGISAVMRAETTKGRVWFKAVFPRFKHEPAVTAWIVRLAPGAAAPVIAIDEVEGWLLLEDVGADAVARHPDADAATIRRLVDLQRGSLGLLDELVALGCPRRPLSSLADDLAAAIEDPVVREWLEVPAPRAEAILQWVREAAERVEALAFPDTLVHGDFHPENVVLRDGAAVTFDWSDAAVSHPLVDAVTWAGFLHDDRDRGVRATDMFLEAWADVCPLDRIEPLRPALTGLAAGYQAVSYARILAGLEPGRRPELADGLVDYFGMLEAAVPA